MKLSRWFSLLLAALLQWLPLSRVWFSPSLLSGSLTGIVYRWVMGAAVGWGGVHAVSGASTVIVSATTAKGTNGVPFKYRILTAPYVANLFSITPLPPRSSLPQGLSLVSSPPGTLSGTPREEGTWQLQLMASDSGRPERTTYATLTLTILPNPNLPPTILTQPKSLTVTNGDPAQFTVVASRNGTIGYQWFFDGATIPDATFSTLTLTNTTLAMAGDYHVVVKNGGGSVTSQVATLTVIQTAPPQVILENPTVDGSDIVFQVQGPVPSTFIISVSSDLLQWSPVSTNTTSDGVLSFRRPLSLSSDALFYRATLAAQAAGP